MNQVLSGCVLFDMRPWTRGKLAKPCPEISLEKALPSLGPSTEECLQKTDPCVLK